MHGFSCRRVVLVVLDGLRPDAIDSCSLPNLLALEAAGASTRSAVTVRPSVTAVAMTSLLTGVPPEVHGMQTDRFHVPRQSSRVHTVPATLMASGLVTSGFLAQPPFLYRRLGHALAKRLGVHQPNFIAGDARQIAGAAEQTLLTQRSGLILFHLPDADQAGHAHGWMSTSYAAAARTLDEATGFIRGLALDDAPNDTLMIVCADHGGGGVVYNDHDSAHPLDCTIPILLAGGGVRPGAALADATILDIPATVLAALRVRRPASYTGRVLSEAAREVEQAA